MLVAALGSAVQIDLDLDEHGQREPARADIHQCRRIRRRPSASKAASGHPTRQSATSCHFRRTGAAVATSVSTSGVTSSCATSTFLDALVDALRLRDTRWAYVGSNVELRDATCRARSTDSPRGM